MDEITLIKKAKKGDREAFAQLYSAYKDRLYRYAFFKLGEDDAADAVSSCVLSAWESIGTLRSEKAFPAWIFRILYRSCSAMIKEQIRQKERDNLEELQLSSPDETLGVELKLALEKLSDEEREIVLLSAVAGCSSREIAGLIGSKATTVRSKLSRSLAKMREYLK